MKRNLKLFALLSIQLFLGASLAAQKVSDNKTDSDSTWLALEAIRVNGFKNAGGKTQVQSYAMGEIRERKYREEGIKFWNKYSNDRRKYIWFATTLSWYLPVQYWVDPNSTAEGWVNPLGKVQEMFSFGSYSAAIDTAAIARWDSAYLKMMEEYQSNFRKEKNSLGQYSVRGQRIPSAATLSQKSLNQYLMLLRNNQYRKYIRCDIDKVFRRFYQSALVAINDQDSEPDNVNVRSPWGEIKKDIDLFLISEYREIGFDLNDVKSFLKKCIADSNYLIQEYGLKKRAIFNLMEQPFMLKHVAMDGRMVDLEKMKGKVVLLDFWNTGCKSCIALMPYLKKDYEKYQKDGFEVVSVCINPESDKEAVIKIKDKIGASWPTLLIGGQGWNDANSLARQIWDTYGFRGVPQLLLLDREGKLIMYNDQLGTENLYKVVEKALAQK